jgi:predicted metal-dependent HD superfamily phosphohydrolase
MPVTPERAAFVQEEFRSVVVKSTPVRDAYGKVARDTKDVPIATFFDNRADALVIAEERLAILGSHGRRFRVVVNEILTESDLQFATDLPGAHLVDSELVADMDVAIASIDSVDFQEGKTTLIVWGRVGDAPVIDVEV